MRDTFNPDTSPDTSPEQRRELEQWPDPERRPQSATPRKGDDIADRLLDLAAGVLKLLPELRRHAAGVSVAAQLERCGPAGGANYEEARGAESPADFVHKVRIALKEVRETRYWLRLAVRAALVRTAPEVLRLVEEANELVAILTACAKTARRRLRERNCRPIPL